jgi:dolichol kinase
MKSNRLSIKQEILRKLIHLLTFSLPLFYLLADRTTGLIGLFAVFLITTFIDIFSKEDRFLNKFIFKYLGNIIRDHERDPRWWKLNGASWVTISAFLVFLIFPKMVAFSGFMILVFGDPAAAIIGKRLGKKNHLGKSWVGTFAFIITSIVVVFLIKQYFNLDNIFLLMSSVSSIIAGLIEAYSGKLNLDDNISVPFSFCVSYLILERIIF